MFPPNVDLTSAATPLFAFVIVAAARDETRERMREMRTTTEWRREGGRRQTDESVEFPLPLLLPRPSGRPFRLPRIEVRFLVGAHFVERKYICTNLLQKRAIWLACSVEMNES